MEVSAGKSTLRAAYPAKKKMFCNLCCTLNPYYAAGGKFGQYKMMQKSCRKTFTLTVLVAKCSSSMCGTMQREYVKQEDPSHPSAINPYAVGDYFGQYKHAKNPGTWVLSESTQ